jgi:hypothetical protein
LEGVALLTHIVRVMSNECVSAGVLRAVFQPTGNFSLSGMRAAAEDSVAVTFRVSKDSKCPSNSNAALLPRLSVLRRNCDGSIRRGAAAKALEEATAR